MAYQGRKNTAGKSYAAAPAAGKFESEQVYFLSVNMGTKEAPEYLTIGNISKYADTQRMVLSLNRESVDKLEVNERGWINGINVKDSKLTGK